MADRVADLMSYGVQTVKAGELLSKIVSRLRRIGHEGFPVVDNGQVIGLLNRRDLDRAVEHGLGDLRIRDVMNIGSITISPDSSVDLLVQQMVETGWGQIPVVDAEGKLIGIVTRTDLIQYWSKSSRISSESVTSEISPTQIETVLGQRAASLIKLVGDMARTQNLNVYTVGGVVRDVLLNRPNLDIDFVVEGDAIAFADSLKKKFGGEVTSFRPFGTAKWRIGDTSFDLDGTGDLPDNLDFATARNEFYEQPTALPSVYNSSIKLDLARRDFTINTLAIQVSPVNGRLLDFFGGVADLNAKLIRVLHNLSFVDDPTRILRAVRFERRLGFTIEPRTVELIDVALPMLRRITGERLRNELTLLLTESDPVSSFLLLQKRGILTAIHPDFILADDFSTRLNKLQTAVQVWANTVDRDDLAWLLLLSGLPVDKISAICQRLLMSKTLTDDALSLMSLIDSRKLLEDAASKPSQITKRLEGLSDTVLLATSLLVDSQTVQQHIEQFATIGRHVKPITTGADLIKRGLKPAPCFKIILESLKDARLDGEIMSDDDESKVLNSLIEAGICQN